MNQEFRPHPVITEYEASCNGVVRHRKLKKPVGVVSNINYLKFGAGQKCHCHRIIYECYNGLIKEGFVTDHIDSNPQNNKLSNLQAITQSENVKRRGTCKHLKNAKCVASKDIHTGEERIFQSMTKASRYFDICRSSIRFVAEGIYKSAISKKTGHISQFVYI
jgi:hypothetical protein